MKQPTLLQRLWAEAYIGKANGDGVEAARIAGYKGSPHVLAQIAYENLKKPHIKALISVRVEEAAMSANEVLKELTKVAKADWQEFLQVRRNKKGEVVDATIVLRDKIRALELMGKYHGLFQENRENDADRERKRQQYERAVAEFIKSKEGKGEACSREQAISTLARIEPEIKEYLN
ncbi:MAG TPA: terminase small subunit [Pyrinomonadaceae bacterium]|nr:terminase small subunit [Pyrinomonadaceae bacterium]